MQPSEQELLIFTITIAKRNIKNFDIFMNFFIQASFARSGFRVNTTRNNYTIKEGKGLTDLMYSHLLQGSFAYLSYCV